MIRVILLCSLFACATSQSLNKAEKRTISIQGSAEMKLTPNLIIWNTRIETVSKDLQDSRESVDKIFNVVKAKLTDAGIKSKDIKLHGNSQSKQYDYEKGKRRFRGYRVSVQVDIKARSLKLYQEVNNILLMSEDISINNTRYDSSEKDKYDLDILEAAGKDAEKKAARLAKTFAMKLGKPISISVNRSTPSPVYARSGRAESMKMMSDASSVQIEDHVGKLTISRSLNITFELLDQ